MKRLFVATLTTLSLSTSAALAADLAYKAARAVMPPLPAYSWTGCYVGAQAGYAFGARSDQTGIINVPVAPGVTVTLTPTNSERASGVMAGGQVGCNYQFSNHVVVGSETEVWYQDIKGSTAPTPIPAPGEVNVSSFSNHFAAASSARIGYAFDRVLAYGKAGAAFATFKHYGYNSLPGGPPLDVITAGDNVSVGLLLGGGLEYAITNQISIKGEYNYINFGNVNHSLITVLDGVTTVYGTTNTHEREQIFKVGMNYRLF